jgi:DNA-binding HxlR family transcriptional regulator
VIDSDEDALIRLTFDLRQVWRGDWVGAVLIVLRRGRMQFSALRDEFANYSFADPWTHKTRALSSSDLSRALGRMTEDGWLIRTERPGEWHPTVSYELSSDARIALRTLTRLVDWSYRSPGFFERARRRRAGEHMK